MNYITSTSTDSRFYGNLLKMSVHPHGSMSAKAVGTDIPIDLHIQAEGIPQDGSGEAP
ncbi:hypothetical protein [Edaphobacter aggregans]|jgi:hypothetical protein|uniref:hypothetical protein n=1 Tax=Edaphobacter aggregans TaxID=570835 RepID=UPI0016397385|nr:hypothetical protein [Edaphobacter aggregans]